MTHRSSSHRRNRAPSMALWCVALAAAMALLFNGSLMVPTGADSSVDRVRASELACPSGDKVLHMQITHGVDGEGNHLGENAGTAAESVTMFLKHYYPGLAATRPSIQSASKSDVVQGLRKNGKLQATVTVHHASSGWLVERFTACNNLLTSDEADWRK